MPSLNLHQIRKTVNTRSDGTALDDVSKINRKLVKASHKVEFMTSEGNSFSDIKTEIKERRPVIAWIKRTPNDRVLGHSVVITDVDDTNLTISYDDPIYGNQQKDIPSFMQEWSNNMNVLIRMRIDRKPPQRELEEF